MIVRLTLLIFIAGAILFAEDSRLLWKSETTVRQGDVLRVSVTGSGLDGATLKAWKEVPFYADGPGRHLALLPVPVRQPAGEYQIEGRNSKGEVLRKFPVTVVDANFPTQNVEVSAGMKQALVPSDDEVKIVNAFLNALTPERFWTEPLRRPAAGCMISRFGVLRLHNGVYSGSYHAGIDLRGATGAPVRAAADGVVGIAQRFTRRGGTIGIDHGQGVKTMYLHLSRILVKPGDKVRKGQLIGRIGATGFATGPHLHWSVHVHGVSVNPFQWTTPVTACGAARTRRK